MKQIVRFVLLAGISAAALLACNKVEEPQAEGPLSLILRAGAPETRTAITSNGEGKYIPSWSANDAIGVYFTEVSGTATEFVNEEAGSIAYFEPSEEITGVSGDQTLYAFYPLGAFNAVASGKGIRVNVKDVQTPDAVGTFDKSTDLLVARPYSGNISTINTDGGIIDLAFARILSVVKVTPTDATSVDQVTGQKALAGEYVKSIKIEYNGAEGDDPLTGRVTLNLETGEFGDWSIKTYSVSAGYEDNVFALNGTNASYLLVNPISIPAGKEVTFTVKTNKHDASKKFTLGNSLAFPAGNIAVIGLSIDDSWTIEDNTLDPNIIFQTPFYAAISSNTTYVPATHGDLGVVGSSKSSITYSFDGTNQLRNNNNKISADDASFYFCTNSTGLVIGGINVGTNRFFTLTYDYKVPSETTTLALSISKDGVHYFPITSSSSISVGGDTDAHKASYSFSIPAGEYTNLRLKFENKGSKGVVIDNVALTRLAEAASGGQSVSFEVIAVDPTLVVSPSPVNLLVGATQQLSVSGTNGAISYQSDDEAIATVTESGLITAVAEGTTTIAITTAATEDYNAGSTSVTVNVSAALTFETIEISESWSADLKTTSGNNAKFKDDGKGVWTVDATYGRKAANNATASSFFSPKFDMSNVAGGSISFAHTGNVTGEDYQTLGKVFYTVDDGTNWNQIVLTNPSSVYSWQTATIQSTIFVGKTIQFRWDFQGNASKTWEVKDFVIIVPKTITITQPSVGGTIAASIDNTTISSGASIDPGKTVTLTATPQSGYVFSSWTVTGATVSGNTSPATFTMGTDPVTVSATFEVNEGDILTQTWTGVSGTSYSNWSGKTGSASSAVYAGNSAGGNSSIQLRSSDNSGIVTTTSGGYATKIKVSWNSNTASGRTLNVYGKNTSYSATSDLYGDNAGDLIGTIVCGEASAELPIPYDYQYIGLRSNSGAMYLDKIIITWSDTPSGNTPPVPTYAVTWTVPTQEGCSIAASVGGNPISSGDEFAQGTVVSISATVGDGYTFGGWSVTGASASDASNTSTSFTVGKQAVNFSASFTSTSGSAPILELDMTTKTNGTSNYNVSTVYGDWTIVNGANNNKGWTYFKMGGKSSTLETYNPCYIYSTKAISNEAGSVTVHLPAGSLSKNGMSVNSWGLYVYSDKNMSSQVDFVEGGTITNSEETFTFTPSSGVTWASGSYFKVCWDLVNTTTTNGIVCVDKISVFPAGN